MGRLNCGKRACAVFLLCAITAIDLPAQTFTTLQSFDSTDGLGGDPMSPRWAASFTTLHRFHYADGQYPYAGLVQATNGNLYGTTQLGGASNLGTVFKITPGGTLTTLQSFDETDGAAPQAGLVQAVDGNLYGTAPTGGASGVGTVFKISPSGTLTTVYSFCSQSGCTDGANPFAGLVQATDGNFYGTTEIGGVNLCGGYGCGTVFKITPGGTLTTLYSFCSQSGCTDGEYTVAGLVQATNGSLYGTTYGGGANGYGTVFKITPGGKLTTLYSFCSQSGCTDGQAPLGRLVQATDGNFYGTTPEGGANGDGTIFKITPSGTLTTHRRRHLRPGNGVQAGCNGQ